MKKSQSGIVMEIPGSKPPDEDIPFDEVPSSSAKAVHCNNNKKQKKHRTVLATLMGGGTKKKRSKKVDIAINSYPSSDAHSPICDKEFQPPPNFHPTISESDKFSGNITTIGDDTGLSQTGELAVENSNNTQEECEEGVTDGALPDSFFMTKSEIFENQVLMHEEDTPLTSNQCLQDEEDTPLTSNQCLQDIKTLEFVDSAIKSNETFEVTNEVVEVDEDEIVVNRVLFLDDEEVQKEMREVQGIYYHTPSTCKGECITVHSEGSDVDGLTNVSQQCSLPDCCADLIKSVEQSTFKNFSVNGTGSYSNLQLRSLWDAAMEMIGSVAKNEAIQEHETNKNGDKHTLEHAEGQSDFSNANTEYVKNVLRKYNLGDGIIEQVTGDLLDAMMITNETGCNDNKSSSTDAHLVYKHYPTPKEEKQTLVDAIRGHDDDSGSEQKTDTTMVAANNNSPEDEPVPRDDDSDIFSFNSPETSRLSDWGSLDSPDKAVANTRCNNVNCVDTRDAEGMNQEALFDPFASFETHGSLDFNKSGKEAEMVVAINDISDFANFNQFRNDSGDDEAENNDNRTEVVVPQFDCEPTMEHEGALAQTLKNPQITQEFKGVFINTDDEQLVSEGCHLFADFSLMNQISPKQEEANVSFGQNIVKFDNATPNFRNRTFASEDSFIQNFPSPRWTPRVEKSNPSHSFDNKRTEDILSNLKKAECPEENKESSVGIKQLPSVLSDASALLESLKRLAISDSPTVEGSIKFSHGEDDNRPDSILDILSTMKNECVQHLDKNINVYAGNVKDELDSCNAMLSPIVEGDVILPNESETNDETPMLPKKLSLKFQSNERKAVPSFVSPVGVMDFATSSATEQVDKTQSDPQRVISTSIAQRIAELQKNYHTN